MFATQFYEVACAITQLVFYTFQGKLIEKYTIHEKNKDFQHKLSYKSRGQRWKIKHVWKKQYINIWLYIKYNSLLKLSQSFKDRTILQMKIINYNWIKNKE